MRFRIEKRCRIYGLYAVLKAHAFVILDSSMVEHSAVNRRVVGSSPTEGAIKRGCAAIYKGGGTFFVSLRVRSIRAFSSVG